MEALTRITYEFGQTFFYIEMDILEFEGPDKVTALDFLLDLRHTVLNGVQILE